MLRRSKLNSCYFILFEFGLVPNDILLSSYLLGVTFLGVGSGVCIVEFYVVAFLTSVFYSSSILSNMATSLSKPARFKCSELSYDTRSWLNMLVPRGLALERGRESIAYLVFLDKKLFLFLGVSLPLTEKRGLSCM
jgi:hypothetical protein